ncbi:glycosyltransferase family 2 protein [Ruegeria marina]|nr:glycosyltransferase family 2 protein [Ruegeria marina]
MSPPTLSVIVPVHDVQDHIGSCLESLKAQTLTDFEAIVVDDGSTDDSPARLRAAIGGDPRFRVVRQENRGLSGARNTGLDLARGAVIGFLDGDDRFAPEFLSRMMAALEESGADWVACGLRNIHSDGHCDSHSALHDAPALAAGDTPRLWPLEDWEQVIAHFPSAWNKLYRRDLIAGLRFDEGTWFEDHAFYLRAAARTRALLHLPEPLYWQTRGRAGQITGSDSERIFEQFPVLDRAAGIMAGPEKPGGDAALARLAHRLIWERSTQVRDPERRARFLATARDWLAARGLPSAPDMALPRDWALELAGGVALSLVLPWDGQAEPLADTLTSDLPPGSELLIVADDAATAQAGVGMARAAGVDGVRGLVAAEPGRGPGPARNAGLAAAAGALVVFVDAGDRLMPGVLAQWCEAMLRAEADMGLSQFRIGLREGHVHSGVHDAELFAELPAATGPLEMTPARALALHCHPSAKIFRRAFLLERDLQFGAGALECWPLVHGAALAAGRVLYFPWPGCESAEDDAGRSLWRSPVPATALGETLDACAALWPRLGDAPLPPGWQRRLWARALWEALTFGHRDRVARMRFLLSAAHQIRRRGLHRMQGPLDPYVSPRIEGLMRLWRSPGQPVASRGRAGQ